MWHRCCLSVPGDHSEVTERYSWRTPYSIFQHIRGVSGGRVMYVPHCIYYYRLLIGQVFRGKDHGRKNLNSNMAILEIRKLSWSGKEEKKNVRSGGKEYRFFLETILLFYTKCGIENTRKKINHAFHDAAVSRGHFGRDKTFSKEPHKYYCKRMKDDIDICH